MHVAGADTKDGSGAQLVGEAHAETPREDVETLVQNMDMDGLNCHKMGTKTGYLGVLRSISVVKARPAAAASFVHRRRGGPHPRFVPRRKVSTLACHTSCAKLQPCSPRAAAADEGRGGRAAASPVAGARGKCRAVKTK